MALPDALASPIWVDKDVLTSEEIAGLRTNGMNLTNFTVETAVDGDLFTIKMHHPNDVIWVESK